jgi:hypothetical protein
MATKVTIPTSKVIVDDNNGNVYHIVTVSHDNNSGADTTDVEVDLSAVSVAELSTSGTGQTKANITITDPTAGDGKKAARIAAAVANGTYTLVIRHIGGGAGTMSSSVG